MEGTKPLFSQSTAGLKLPGINAATGGGGAGGGTSPGKAADQRSVQRRAASLAAGNRTWDVSTQGKPLAGSLAAALGSTARPRGPGATGASTMRRTLSNSRKGKKAGTVSKDRDTFRSALVNILMAAEKEVRNTELPPLQGASPAEEAPSLLGSDGAAATGTSSAEKDLMRYYYYIKNGIDTEHVAAMEDSMLDSMMEMVGDGGLSGLGSFAPRAGTGGAAAVTGRAWPARPPRVSGLGPPCIRPSAR